MKNYNTAIKELQVMYSWNEFHRTVVNKTNFNRNQMKDLQREINLKKKEVNELKPKKWSKNK